MGLYAWLIRDRAVYGSCVVVVFYSNMQKRMEWAEGVGWSLNKGST